MICTGNDGFDPDRILAGYGRTMHALLTAVQANGVLICKASLLRSISTDIASQDRAFMCEEGSSGLIRLIRLAAKCLVESQFISIDVDLIQCQRIVAYRVQRGSIPGFSKL
jgi:hypothetical protein